MAKELTPSERIQAAKEILALLESKELSVAEQQHILHIVTEATREKVTGSFGTLRLVPSVGVEPQSA